MTPGVVYFIGAGPGDPDLLTMRAHRFIQEADLVVWADSLIHPDVIALARPDARVVPSSGLTLEEITQLLVSAARDGLRIARLQSGDPSIYGAMHEQQVLLAREDVPFEIVPGVSSAFAAAARLGVELTVPNVAQTVVMTRVANRTTTVPDLERLRDLARSRASLVLFLSASVIERVVDELRAAGYADTTPAAVVYRVSWPDEQVIRGTLGDVAVAARRAGLTRQALILVGEVLDPNLLNASSLQRSHLYRPDYTHLFRRAEETA